MEPNQQERRQQERRQQERREQEIRQEELRQEELRQEEEEVRQEERRQEEVRQQEIRQQVRQQALRPETPNASTSAGESSEPGTRSGIRSGIKKRKAPHEYSTNPNTMRVRERNAKLSPYQLAVERAKSNDLKAVSTAWRDRGETEAFQRASPAEKERIIAETEEEVMVRRRRKGIDADTKILALNLQFSEDERSPGLSSGGLAGTGAGKGKSVPAMAPPGYQPFPTQPLPHLMGRGKKPAFPGAGPATSAGRASLSEDDAAGPVLERQDYPMMDRANAEFSAAIEDFKNLQAEGDRRSAEERLYIMTQLRLLRGDVTTLGQQLEQLMALLQQPAGRQEAAPLQQQHVSAQQQQQHASAQQHGPAQQQHASSVYGNHPSGPHTYPLPPIQGSSAHQSTHQPWRCYTTALSKFADNKFADDGDHY